jgi:putative SOS response-associated peptidase YedK
VCGRFATDAPLDALLEALGIDGGGKPLADLVEARADVRPGTDIAAVANEVDARGHRQLGLFHWGFVPRWAKARGAARAPGESSGRDASAHARPPRQSAPRPLVNARGETLADKPTFREAARRRRAVVPASLFYEWQSSPAGRGRKRQFALRRADGAPLAMGAVWEERHDPETGEVLRSIAIVTTDANAEVRPIHDRMPLVLERVDLDRWLEPRPLDAAAIRALARPAADGTLVAAPVRAEAEDRRAAPAPLEGASALPVGPTKKQLSLF